MNMIRIIQERTVAACPDILPQYLDQVKFSFKPRLSIKWRVRNGFPSCFA